MKYTIGLLIFGAFFSVKTFAQTTISAADASKHIGETVTVSDKVYGGKLISQTNMTLLDLGGRYPNQLLTIMIPGVDRNKFKGMPETDYKGKSVRVTGKLVDYKGKPEIIVDDPAEMKVLDK